MHRIRTGRNLARSSGRAPARPRVNATFLLLCVFGFIYGIVVPKVEGEAAPPPAAAHASDATPPASR
jgi:hypothetical protein